MSNQERSETVIIFCFIRLPLRVLMPTLMAMLNMLLFLIILMPMLQVMLIHPCLPLLLLLLVPLLLFLPFFIITPLRNRPRFPFTTFVKRPVTGRASLACRAGSSYH